MSSNYDERADTDWSRILRSPWQCPKCGRRINKVIGSKTPVLCRAPTKHPEPRPKGAPRIIPCGTEMIPVANHFRCGTEMVITAKEQNNTRGPA